MAEGGEGEGVGVALDEGVGGEDDCLEDLYLVPVGEGGEGF